MSIQFDIAPEVRALLGEGGDLPIREAVHAEDPVCWACGELILVRSESSIAVLARKDRRTDVVRIGCTHTSCQSSRVELVDYDIDELQDAMLDHEFMLADAQTALFAFMEPHHVLHDPASGESLNQRRLLEIGCRPITGTWPSGLVASPLRGWRRVVTDDTLQVVIAGTNEAIGSWSLGDVSPRRAENDPLTLLIGERIGLVDLDLDRLATSIHAGAVVGGTVPASHPARGLLARLRGRHA